MAKKKQEYRKRLLGGEPPRFFNFIVYTFMWFLTVIAILAIHMLKESTPFESLIILLIVACICFWILRESILRIHWIYSAPGLLLFVAIITRDLNIVNTSITILIILYTIFILDYFGLLSKFIRIMHEVIKK